MTAPPLSLLSHVLCPYVQRAAIVLAEKGVAFDRRWVDLADKPDWFVAISPLGKTPVLLVGEVPIFESAVICEYLDETLAPRLHPVDPLARARHRAWMEFGSAVLSQIVVLYNAPDEAALRVSRNALVARFAQLEATLEGGPLFAGEAFSLVDAVFAPVFRYFDVFDTFTALQVFDATPKLQVWRTALAQRPSVRDAVGSDYNERLVAFVRARRSALSVWLAAAWLNVTSGPPPTSLVML